MRRHFPDNYSVLDEIEQTIQNALDQTDAPLDADELADYLDENLKPREYIEGLQQERADD